MPDDPNRPSDPTSGPADPTRPTSGPADPTRPTSGPADPTRPAVDLSLVGLDAERPLPAELRARLESALLAAVAGGLPVPADAESLDAPRPLPDPLRARLEAALLAEAGASPSPAPASEPAAPAASTPAMAGATSAVGSAAPTAAEAASAPTSPTAVAGRRAAGEVISLDGRRRKVVAVWSSVAAAVLLVIAVAGLAGRGGEPGSEDLLAGGTTTSAPTSAPLPSGAEVTAEPLVPGVTAPAPDAPAPATTRPNRQPRPTTTTAGPQPGTQTARPSIPDNLGSTSSPTSPASPGGGSADPPAPQPAGNDPGPAPPFYDSSSEAGSPAPAMSSQPGASAGAAPSGDSQTGGSPQKSAAPAGPALRVGIITGDAAQEAGFRAYVNRLNANGGVQGHTLELVPVSAGSPAAGLVATVNLSPQPVAGPGGAPGWATGPLLETLTTPESLLSGNGAVFSFASPPERQGRLAADALFPSAVTDRPKAVIYAAPAGPLADVVPQAMKAALEKRGVNVIIRTYDPARNPNLDDSADAALLSLDPAAAKAWVAEAKAAGYRPARGVAGIYSLFDDTLAPDLPEGARVVSPYQVPGGAEGEAIRSGAGGASAPVLHGWATAKALAAAIWRTGADTPAELQAALEGLAGWSSGLAPPYETRPNTRARTPEGVLFEVRTGAFTPQGGFRRDS